MRDGCGNWYAILARIKTWSLEIGLHYTHWAVGITWGIAPLWIAIFLGPITITFDTGGF